MQHHTDVLIDFEVDEARFQAQLKFLSEKDLITTVIFLRISNVFFLIYN